jgi:hypothetical protein
MEYKKRKSRKYGHRDTRNSEVHSATGKYWNTWLAYTYVGEYKCLEAVLKLCSAKRFVCVKTFN